MPLVVPLLIAAACIAVLVLITLAVTRGVPRSFWLTALCVFGVGIAFMVALSEIGKPTVEKREVPVTPKYAASVRKAGFPISVQRAFEASSFGGFHGDGARVTAYRYPTTESDTLVRALKHRETGFTWQEAPSRTYEFSSLRQLLPSDFLPERDSRSLLIGRAADGLPIQEFVVDRSRGIFYCIDNVF